MTSAKKTVLLIDDDPAVSAALCMLLKDEFDTHSAGTVKEGVRLFDTLHPSAVVLDLHLPDSHGLQALRSIRRMDRSAQVIILTGFATLEVVEESMRLGASDCLHKPFDAAVLKSRLKELTVDPDVPRRPAAEEKSVQVGSELSKDRADELASSAFLHDIGNPLTSLLAFSAVLKESAKDAEKCEQLAAMIHENTEYMSSLVEQWRAFSEPETLAANYAEVGEITEQTAKLVRLRANAKQVKITVSVSNRTARPLLNRHAAVRVLVNLVQNAIEAVDSGTGEIDLYARVKDGLVEFIVRDNGCGIPTEATQVIFQPRYSTKRRGTGLGLYIARNIVESAHGAISIFSRPGNGTSFTVQLPAC